LPRRHIGIDFIHEERVPILDNALLSRSVADRDNALTVGLRNVRIQWVDSGGRSGCLRKSR
jgi:hypothetical protein